MAEIRLDEIASAVGGRLEGGGGRTSLRHFLFDTRELQAPHSLFFALRGEHADGHRYLGKLNAFPHCAAVVAADWEKDASFPIVRVDDPLAAAHRLCRHLRGHRDRVRYAGITGSAGKTSTKEFLYRLLSTRFPTHRSRGNWNNWIGLPFSLLNMPEGTEAAVFELAMSDPGIGEIRRLAEILRPDTAVILNALPVHLEFLGSVGNVARAKMEIAACLEADDCLLVNGDDPHLAPLLAGQTGRVVRFGRDGKRNQVVLREIRRDGTGSEMVTAWWGREARFRTNLIHHVQLENLFAAMAAAQQMGIKHEEMRQVLENLEPLQGRGVIRRVGRFTVVDETYNSNPEAVKRLLAWADGEFPAPRVAVLGDMLELGAREKEFHREVGEFWSRLGYAALVTVGPLAESMARGAVDAGADSGKVVSLATPEAAAEYVERNFPGNCVLVVKASRGIRLERMLEVLSHD